MVDHVMVSVIIMQCSANAENMYKDSVTRLQTTDFYKLIIVQANSIMRIFFQMRMNVQPIMVVACRVVQIPLVPIYVVVR